METDKIVLKYSKRENDIVCSAPCSPDARLAISTICNDKLSYSISKQVQTPKEPYYIENFMQELIKRGYDIKTIKFSVKKLKTDS